jgi:hypothetical protein
MTKDELIEKYRYVNVEYEDWWDWVYEGFVEDMGKKGIHVDSIDFDGFYHQGSYATFTGRVNNAPLFMKSFGLAENFPSVYEVAEQDGFHAKREGAGRWRHSTYDFELDHWMYLIPSIDDQEMMQYYIDLKQEGVDNEINKFEREFTDVFNEIDEDLYVLLRDAYEDLISDEVVWETIVANEWDKEAA